MVFTLLHVVCGSAVTNLNIFKFVCVLPHLCTYRVHIISLSENFIVVVFLHLINEIYNSFRVLLINRSYKINSATYKNKASKS